MSHWFSIPKGVCCGGLWPVYFSLMIYRIRFSNLVEIFRRTIQISGYVTYIIVDSTRMIRIMEHGVS